MPEKKEPSSFGVWLIEARGRAGLTQQQLVDLCGLDDDGNPRVHLNTIKHIENGVTQRPAARIAEALKAALGDAPTPERARDAMDQHTRAFLDLIGAYLMRLPAEDRLGRIFELTREILSKP